MTNKKAKGKRAKTRRKFKKRGGTTTVNTLLREFQSGSRVEIAIDPAVHSGLPHKHYQGKSGVVAGKQGRMYAVSVRKGGLGKTLLVHSAHLKQARGGS